jgi:hypothetical protein
MRSGLNNINKTLIYSYEPTEEVLPYNLLHGTEYEYKKFPKGRERVYKPTRFIEWEPIPEDIFMRHAGKQIFLNFRAIMPDIDPLHEIFQMRSKRVELQNLICEQINFFTALYDQDNDLIQSMLVAKYITDSQTYTVATFEEYYLRIFEVLFPQRTIDKIKLMVEENDVGDDVVGLFTLNFLRDVYIVSFMIKVMHIFIEHFVLSTGNPPKDLYELFAAAYTHMMNHINPNMYKILYGYVHKSVVSSINSNANIYDMQAIDGVTAPTAARLTMHKSLLCDGLIKLTFASVWDPVNKRPTFSCVGLIKAIVEKATSLTRKTQLRFSLVNIDDISQLLENITSGTSISLIRSFDPGEYSCMRKDLDYVIAQIAVEVDLSPVDFYLEHLPTLNDLSKILINTILYNKFHSSISIDTLSAKQKYILLLYVRHLIMGMYGLTEEMTKGHPLINILMGRTVSSTSKTLTTKDLNNIKKYVKSNQLEDYLLSEKNVNMYVESVQKCVLASYTIVNHNDVSLLESRLEYDSQNMTLNILDVLVNIFEMLKGNTV